MYFADNPLLCVEYANAHFIGAVGVLWEVNDSIRPFIIQTRSYDPREQKIHCSCIIPLREDKK